MTYTNNTSTYSIKRSLSTSRGLSTSNQASLFLSRRRHSVPLSWIHIATQSNGGKDHLDRSHTVPKTQQRNCTNENRAECHLLQDIDLRATTVSRCADKSETDVSDTMASSSNSQPKSAAVTSPDVPTPLARYHYWLLVFGQGRPPSWDNFQRMASARARKGRALEAQARVIKAQDKAEKARRKAEKAKTKADEAQRKAELAAQAAAHAEAMSGLRHTGLTDIVAGLLVGQGSPRQLLPKAEKKSVDGRRKSIKGRVDGSDAAKPSRSSSVSSSVSSSSSSSKNGGSSGEVEEQGEEGGDGNDASSPRETSAGHYCQPTVEDKESEEGS
ncbi:hypothetical protein B0T22DRAFT_96800 [Podospora appendiculata]|uniref:Uncharacterized protein n=1 Tax=Podospora appendiculata TaxID=314037 RepID=A0AAE0XKL1_9PEZI|nr:hypothetical protein B0T22DRAFT_96800 [Podospora appendiculata]